MKTLTLTIILTTISFLDLFGQNLISNSSFDDSTGQLLCKSWYDRCGVECDTTICNCFTCFYQDSPPGGGSWSIGAEGGWVIWSVAKTYITGQSGTNIYELNFWMKDTGNVSSTVSIRILSQGQITHEKSFIPAANIWTYFTLIDTLTLQPSDSIEVQFSMSGTQWTGGVGKYDLVELTIVDTLTFIQGKNLKQTRDINVYPNPFKNFTTIEFKKSKNRNYTLTIYSSVGQLVQKINGITSGQVKIETKNLTNGLYFYQIQNDLEIVGNGKLVKE